MNGIPAGTSGNLSGTTVYFDNNALMNITRSSETNVRFVTQNSSSVIVITQTVMGEARNNLTGENFAVLANQVYGNPHIVSTPYTGHAPGNNNGEISITYHINRTSPTGTVVVVSGDGLSSHRPNSEWQTELPSGSVVLNTVEFANSMLRSGDMSLTEYYTFVGQLATIPDMARTEFFRADGTPIPYIPGNTYLIDGVEVKFFANGWIVDGVFHNADGLVSISDGGTVDAFGTECFLAGTPIDMWPLDPEFAPDPSNPYKQYDQDAVRPKIWKKPIEQVKVGDYVVSFDKNGNMLPGYVPRTMQNNATNVLDFWGTGVTPGHACYCADGQFKGDHAPIMDILRTDTAMMRTDGTMFRASTNCTVGTMGDMMIHAAATVQKPDGSWTEPKPGKVRFGTRVILPDGRDVSLMELAHEEGWKVTDEGYMVGQMKGDDGTVAERAFHFPYRYSKELPKPEDYILKRSAVTLEEIYQAGEWEQIGTRMPAPASMVGFNPNNTSTMFQPSKPRPNIPPTFANRPDAPVAQAQAQTQRPTQASAKQSMNRKQRKAMEAKQRKATKIRKRTA